MLVFVLPLIGMLTWLLSPLLCACVCSTADCNGVEVFSNGRPKQLNTKSSLNFVNLTDVDVVLLISSTQ